MALGAMSANPGLNVRIVPVGLSYFHPHKFRSRAVIEFGTPIDVPAELAEKFASKDITDKEKKSEARRAAIGEMLETIRQGLISVTVTTPDYDTLMVSS